MSRASRTWILLRGLTRESGHWGPFTEQFKRAFVDDTVFSLDLPGTGVHFRERSPSTVGELMEKVRAEYHSKRTDDRPVAHLAHSLGGMISLAWAEKYPNELERTVVVNPSVSGLSPLKDRLQREGLSVGWKLARARSARERERAIMEWIVNDPVAREANLEDWTRIRLQRPVSGGNVFRQLLAGARFRLTGAPPKIPTLILCGEGDRLAAPACSRALQKHLGCDLAAHPTAGHDLSMDAPDWMIAAVSDWMKKTASP